MDEVLVYILRELKENCILVSYGSERFFLYREYTGPDGYICELNSHQYNLLANDGWKVHKG